MGYPGEPGAPGMNGLDGLNGLDGAPGAPGADGLGYDWKVTEPSDSADFDSSTMYLFSDVGFGAYAVGNYVRYYVNPDEDPLGWVEGEIEGISPTALLLSVKSWSPEAEGMEGQPGGTWTIAPYMTLIGRPGADGAGYDVTVDANASYTEIQKLLASDPSSSESFGNAVSISGDGKTMVVGASYEDTAPNDNNGAVYVFTRSGASWVEQAKLLASDAEYDENFGWSVDISEDGNTIIVGSLNTALASGSAYIFTRSGTTWSKQAKLLASDATIYENFGSSVSISGNGNTVVVGASNEDTAPDSDNGAAYIFTRLGSTWTEQSKLLASDIASYDYFGNSVAISADGSTVFVQASSESTAPNVYHGAVYVFTNSGSSWTEQSKLLASDTTDYQAFGNSISASQEGNTVVIGSMFKTTTPNDVNGAVYVFTRSGTTWTEQSKLLASDAESYQGFGTSVSISADGNTIVVGAAGESTDPNSSNGAVYIFTRSGTAWTEQAKLLSSNPNNYDFLGTSVSISSGGTTIVVSALEGPRDVPISGSGSAYVFNLQLTWNPAEFSIGAYLDNSYVKALSTSSPSTYAEGILNTLESVNYSILVESASGSFALDAPNTVSLSITGVPGITGANGADGTNGVDGTDGAGYDYVMPENYGGPGIELEPLYTTVNLVANAGSGAFGAYAVGNYVRYYPNPEADPTAWVEGEITSRTTDSYEYLTILIDNWSPTAPGIYGASFDATIRPYMTLIGKKGDQGGYGASASYFNTIDIGPFSPGSGVWNSFLSLDSIDWEDGIVLSNGYEITMQNDGKYNIAFSAQVRQTQSSGTVNIYLAKNGSRVPNSNTKVSMSSSSSFVVAAWNFFVDAAAGDTFAIAISGDSSHTILEAEPESTLLPATPSVILTVNQVG
jgi:hypothetical protein